MRRATDTRDTDSAAIRAAFQAVYLEDRAAGRVRPVEAYLARFPGFEDVVREELEELERRASSAGAGLPDPEAGTGPFPALLSEGRRLGPHVLRRPLGRGGQGEVWAAEHGGLGREVALKLLLDPGLAGGGAYQRFDLEVRTLASLQHPAVCRVHDAGVEDGYAYFSMDLVLGPSLKECIERRAAEGPPDREWTRRATRWCEQLAEGLHHAHQHRILHRDVKPANVLLDGRGQPVLVDFGLAKRMDDDGAGLTGTLASIGTRDYMSPEQLGGGMIPLDQRSDVYSLGLVLYELLTLRRAHEGGATEVRRGLARRPAPPPVRRRNPHVSRDLERVVEKAMAFERADRYDNAEELAEDLARVRQDRPVRARPAGPVRRGLRWARRSPGTAATLVGVIGLLVTALVLVQAARRREFRESLGAHAATVAAAARTGDLATLNQALGDVPREGRGFVWGVLRNLAFPHRAWARIGPSASVTLVPSGDDLLLASNPCGLGRVSIQDRWTSSELEAGDDPTSHAALDPEGQYWVCSTRGELRLGRRGDPAALRTWSFGEATNHGRPWLSGGARVLWLQRAGSLYALVDPLSGGDLGSPVRPRDERPPGGLRLILGTWSNGDLLALHAPASPGPPEPSDPAEPPDPSPAGAEGDPPGPAPAVAAEPRDELVRVRPDGALTVLRTVPRLRVPRGAWSERLRQVVLWEMLPGEDGRRPLLRLPLAGGTDHEHWLPVDLEPTAGAVGVHRTVLGTRDGQVLLFDDALRSGSRRRRVPGGWIAGLLLNEEDWTEPHDDTLWVATSGGLLHRLGFGPEEAGTPCALPGHLAEVLGFTGGKAWTRAVEEGPEGVVAHLRAWSVTPERGLRMSGSGVVPGGISQTQAAGGRMWQMDREGAELLWVRSDGEHGSISLPPTSLRAGWSLVRQVDPSRGLVLRNYDQLLLSDGVPEVPADLRPAPMPLDGAHAARDFWFDRDRAWWLGTAGARPLGGPVRGGGGALGRALDGLHREVRDAVLSRDGRVLLLRLEPDLVHSRLLALDTRTGEHLGPPIQVQGQAGELCLSADGARASARVEPGRVRVWEVASGRIELDLAFPGYPIAGHLLDPDLGWLLVLGEDRRLHLLEAAPASAPVWGAETLERLAGPPAGAVPGPR